jgi:hypothetical protein
MRMKKINLNFGILFIAFVIGFMPISEAQNSPNIQDFSIRFFNSLKSNDFNGFIILLPTPPFTINLKSLGQGKENITITKEEFEKWKTNYQNQFNSILSAIKTEGLILADLKLDKIIVEYDNDNKFQTQEIYLILNSIKGRYRIRIEDCFNIDGKLLPEQLKWFGAKEFRK